MSTTIARSSATIMERRARIGELDLFYLDAAGDTPLVLLHGLSANASSFTALIHAGLAPAFRVIAPDLRGRARSDKPAFGYTMADHAGDVVGLMDHLGIERAVLAGHSFGGYLAIYLAAHFPDRFSRVIVIDAAINSHPRVGEMLRPSLDRLGKTVSSPEAYLSSIQTAAYMNGMWDAHVDAYFRAELVQNPDGTAQSATSASAIGQAMYGLACEPWLHLVQQVKHPTLMINAVEPYGPPGTPPLMEETWARATANAFGDGHYVKVPGNHITMLFTDGAIAMAREIAAFSSSAASVSERGI
jgi:pimeloyl-ACP methyl ester carboxylesterase